MKELRKILHPVFVFIWFLPGCIFAQSSPEAAATLDSTNLPLIIINTSGLSIPEDTKISAAIKIIDHDDGRYNKPGDTDVKYEGKIGIEKRGHFSAYLPQAPYSFETRDSAGNNLNVSLLGMPEENDWLLLANYNDKSFVRNMLSYKLFSEMGHYSTRAKLCEVILNSKYSGIYVFTEKIKPDKDRLNISQLNAADTTGPEVTGGYIISVDYSEGGDNWISSYPPLKYPGRKVHYNYVYPKPADITIHQKKYIQSFIKNAEGALYGKDFSDPETGYSKYLDVNSFIDYFIISELSRNVDGYKKSRFFYKNRDDKDSLLYAGPVWDFDWAWKNIPECIFGRTDGSGWGYLTNDCNSSYAVPDWHLRLLQDSYFTNELITRYTELRSTILSVAHITAFIDSVKLNAAEASARHFAVYPINHTNGAPEIESPPKSFGEEISRLKEWIRKRINWLDINIPKLKDNVISSVENDAIVYPQTLAMQNYPNPFNAQTSIRISLPGKAFTVLTVYDILGNKINDIINEEMPAGEYSIEFNTAGLASGLYIARLKSGANQKTIKMIYLK